MAWIISVLLYCHYWRRQWPWLNLANDTDAANDDNNDDIDDWLEVQKYSKLLEIIMYIIIN